MSAHLETNSNQRELLGRSWSPLNVIGDYELIPSKDRTLVTDRLHPAGEPNTASSQQNTANTSDSIMTHPQDIATSTTVNAELNVVRSRQLGTYIPTSPSSPNRTD